jgi:hypothetical protein
MSLGRDRFDALSLKCPSFQFRINHGLPSTLQPYDIAALTAHLIK